MDKLTARENISIVDLRQPMDIEAFPQMIPGALRIAMEEIEERHGEIPPDRDVVLDCSRPNEATSARVALLLRAKESPGFARSKAGSTPGSRSISLSYRKPRQKTRCPVSEGLR